MNEHDNQAPETKDGTFFTSRPAPEQPRLQSIVFRLPSSRMQALKKLSAETRVLQSVYLREAIADLLAKHAAHFAVVLALAATCAGAQPFGPDTQLPGWGPNLSKAIMTNGAQVLGNMARALGRPLPTGRAFTCALAMTVEAVVEANAVSAQPPLTAAEVRGVQRVRAYLQDVQKRHCDRPPGGGPGTGNEGDRLVKEAADRAPLNRQALGAREWMVDHLGLPADALAVDAALVAAALLAGASTGASLVLP